MKIKALVLALSTISLLANAQEESNVEAKLMSDCEIAAANGQSAGVVDEAKIDRTHVQTADAVRPTMGRDASGNGFFDTHAELTKEEVDKSLQDGLVPKPKHETPTKLPERRQSKSTRVQQVVEETHPLNPTQIRQIRGEVGAREQALNENPAAQTGGRTINMSLQNVNQQPVIQIAQGYVANIAFIDQYGNPWPVEGKSVGNMESFTVIELGMSADSNQIQINGKRSYGNSNMIVLLKGAPAPLVFDLKGSKVNDSRVDVVVAGTAPGADAPRPDAILPPETDTAYSRIMTDLRNGIVSEKLTQLFTNANMQLYQDEDGAMYAVSMNEIIQPSCQAIVYGNAGLRICKMDYVPSTLLYVESGQVAKAVVRTTR